MAAGLPLRPEDTEGSGGTEAWRAAGLWTCRGWGLRGDRPRNATECMRLCKEAGRDPWGKLRHLEAAMLAAELRKKQMHGLGGHTPRKGLRSQQPSGIIRTGLPTHSQTTRTGTGWFFKQSIFNKILEGIRENRETWSIQRNKMCLQN